MSKNHLTVNEHHTFSMEQVAGKVMIDGEELKVDMERVNDHTYHLIHHDISYTAELVSLNAEEKKAMVKINGQAYEVVLKDHYDLLLESMGMQFTQKLSVSILKAPMPGLVLSLMVKVGDAVEKGDSLLILEAMKMENIIKASENAVIKSIEIVQHSVVEKNQILLTFE